ncbi:MAG: hypothetical protein COC03_00555 [Robiginitomaculum sp.]|nr:MAG: hypothetical protein COC03_00555 [Robiginitomaculum sp.]
MLKSITLNLLGIIVATVVFYLLGYLWYGMIFSEMWLTFNGITEADAAAQAAKMGNMMYIGGIAITLAQVLGLTYILHLAKASTLFTSVKTCTIIAVLIALPLMMYAHIYEGASQEAIALNFAHTLVGYILVGVILGFFRGKKTADE